MGLKCLDKNSGDLANFTQQPTKKLLNWSYRELTFALMTKKHFKDHLSNRTEILHIKSNTFVKNVILP